MKNRILAAALLSMCLLASCAKQNVSSQTQSADADDLRSLTGDAPGSFRSVELTPEVETACAAAIGKMELMRDVRKAEAVNTMSAAQELIYRNINVAVTPSSRACVEYKGWFLVSRLNTARQDDGSFKTGIAVSKGTTKIYQWE